MNGWISKECDDDEQAFGAVGVSQLKSTLQIATVALKQ